MGVPMFNSKIISLGAHAGPFPDDPLSTEFSTPRGWEIQIFPNRRIEMGTTLFIYQPTKNHFELVKGDETNIPGGIFLFFKMSIMVQV